MKTTPFATHTLDAEMIAQIYRGEISHQHAPDLYAALHAEDDAFDPFLAFHAPNEPLELDAQESEAILRSILQQTSLVSSHSTSATDAPFPAADAPRSAAPLADTRRNQHTQTSDPSKPSLLRDLWQSFRRAWLAPVAVGMAALLIFPVLSNRSTSSPSSQTPIAVPNQPLPRVISPTTPRLAVPDILHKGDRDRLAFFAVDLYPAALRAQDPKKAHPFRNNATLHPEDALLFHFINLQRGYLYLLREDAQGRFETLYPFDPKRAIPQSPGKITLKQAEQPMVYVLEPKMIGRQRFWLLHSPIPQTFPHERNALSPALRKLFLHADHITLFVRQRE